MQTLNLGILAHVDAGKTTLTERLLFAAGVIDEIGSVDAGTTQTDSLALERQRGITIKSAVVSFVVNDVAINLIDTPGHPEFIAEVERVLNVLDGAVLVISAVEGVQAQTRVLMRTLGRLEIPTLIFVNKIDRMGAQEESLVAGIADKLGVSIVPMGSTNRIGTREAGHQLFDRSDDRFVAELTDRLADHDDRLLAAFVRDESAVSYGELHRKLVTQTKRAWVHPLYFGSAITGAGVDHLTAGITEFLPTGQGKADGDPSGAVFKVERGPAGEKIAYVRMFAGQVATRDLLAFGRDLQAKVTGIRVFDRGAAPVREKIFAGQIGKIWGLADVQIGDVIGRSRLSNDGHHFAPPTLETVVLPSRRSDKAGLFVALTQIAEQDPLIDLRQDDVRGELYVSLYGEVQKEVVQATLANDYGIDVEFRESTTICIERPIGAGEAVEMKGERSNPFPLGGVGLRIEPAGSNSGVAYRRAGETLGTIPRAFFKAIEETVHVTLHQGLHGWQVTDCIVTLTYSAYTARHSHAHQKFNKSMSSTAGDYRGLTPLVLMAAVKRAGTRVCEPVHRFQIEAPADTLGSILPALTRLAAIPDTPTTAGSSCVLDGAISAGRIDDLARQLPSLTRGEGVLDYAFDRYEPIRGAIPSRQRTDNNPLDRKEYLLHVVRRV